MGKVLKSMVQVTVMAITEEEGERWWKMIFKSKKLSGIANNFDFSVTEK